MNRLVRRIPIAGVALALMVAVFASGRAADAGATSTPLLVGLRRSSYGLRKQNADDVWWTTRAKTFAAQFPGAQPVILHILSTYQDDGTTEIEFPTPPDYHGATTGMTFQRGRIDHERALATYDTQGVSAILQFEPGSADVSACFELALAAFAQHPCVIGLAIDAEWFRTKQSTDATGLPISDTDAQRWMELVLRFRPTAILVLKHFEAKHLPPTYRHPNLLLLTDSQDFTSHAEWLADMHAWQTAFPTAALGAQYGYPKDRKWWARLPTPPVTMAHTLLHDWALCRLLLWVDFTADKVEFGQ